MSILLSLFLSIVPPVVELPAELNVCILQAELCARDAAPAMCGELDAPALEQCIADYETCAQPFPEAGSDSCQIARVWCALEAPFSIELGVNDDMLKACVEIAEACPAY